MNLWNLGWAFINKDVDEPYWKMPVSTVERIYNNSIRQVLDAVEQEILSHRENANCRWMYGHSHEGDITNAPRTTIPVPRKKYLPRSSTSAFPGSFPLWRCIRGSTGREASRQKAAPPGI